MASLQLYVISSVEALRAQSALWDDLWVRSAVSLPTARAELAAAWVEHFAPHARFRALAVAEGERLVAALPLVGRRVRRVVRAGDLTWNYWSPNGELLLDETAGAEAALDLLAQGLQESPWPLLWFEMPPVDAPRWQMLAAALGRRGIRAETRRRYEVGAVAIGPSFEEYLAARSDNLRKKVRKGRRRLEGAGRLVLNRLDRLAPDEVEAALDRAWAVEDLSWKGQAASSVLHTPGMREFYLRQARTLAAWGHLRVCFLELNGRDVAFAVGWEGKGVYQVSKIGYDPDYSQSSPGNVLWLMLIESLHQSRECHTLDFLGPLVDATRSWATGAYWIGRIAAGLSLRGRTLLAGYRLAASLVQSSPLARGERGGG